MKRWLVVWVLLGLANSVFAQTDPAREYEEFRRQQTQEYRDFQKKRNTEYADFLKREWELFQSFKAQQRPEMPKPVKPPFVPDREIPQVPGSLKGGPLKAVPVPELKKIPPLVPAPVEWTKTADFVFYGQNVEIPFSDRLKIHCEGIAEKNIGNYWEKMARSPYRDFLEVVGNYSGHWGLNEWGEYKLIESVAREVFPDPNDRVLFCFFMMRENGFAAKVGRSEKRLYLLLAFEGEVYGLPYFAIGNRKYYRIENTTGEQALYTFGDNASDRQLKGIDLRFRQPLHLGTCNEVKELHLEKFPELVLNVPYNTHHRNFYNEMPAGEFSVYFASVFPPETQQKLAESLGKLREERNMVEYVGILLNFVQTSFEYATDEKQFGQEKYFFPEEVLMYPSCDCEDRAAFFARLVREFTGLDVIGLYYPGHVSTAVCFGGESVEGDQVTYRGKKYVMCDPTYIHASIGMTMPQFRGKKAQIIDFNN